MIQDHKIFSLPLQLYLKVENDYKNLKKEYKA